MTLYVSLLDRGESTRIYGYRVLFSIKPKGSNPTSREYVYLFRGKSEEVPYYVQREIEEDIVALEEVAKGRVYVFSTKLKEANPRARIVRVPVKHITINK